MSVVKKCALLLCLISLSACVYRLPINQGNFIKQDDLEKVRVGLTKKQVHFLLGTPQTKSAFSDDRWHYVLRIKPAKGEVTQKRFTVDFKDGKVVAIEDKFSDKTKQKDNEDEQETEDEAEETAGA